MQIHENFLRVEDEKKSSDRIFGIVISSFLGIISAVCFYMEYSWHWWLLSSVLILLVAITKSNILKPFNGLWFKFGLLLHRCINPIILGLMFYGVILPIGILMRIVGKRPLNMKFESDSKSYWILRATKDSELNSMKNQF